MVGLELPPAPPKPPAPPAAVLLTSPVVRLTGPLVLLRDPLVKVLPPLEPPAAVVSPTLPPVPVPPAPPAAVLLAVWVWSPLLPPVAELVLALLDELSSVMLGKVPEPPEPVT